MKYIKTYEGLTDRYVFYIPYNDLDLIDLVIRKMECFSENFLAKLIQEIKESYDMDYVQGVFIFVGVRVYSYEREDSEGSFWVVQRRGNLIDAEKHYKDEDIKYLGEIKLEDWEINALKYNL